MTVRWSRKVSLILAKYWKAVLGAIALAILGNLAYDLLKSSAPSIASAVWQVGTLGLRALQDSTYVDMAKGFREHPSIVTMNIAFLAFMFAIGWLVGAVSRLRRREAELAEKAEAISRGTRSSSEIEDDLRHLQSRARDVSKRAKSLFYQAMFFGIVLGVWSAFLSARTSVISDGISSFEQSIRVLGPSLSIAEERVLRAKFASMRGKADFDAVRSLLKEKALQANIELPGRP